MKKLSLFRVAWLIIILIILGCGIIGFFLSIFIKHPIEVKLIKYTPTTYVNENINDVISELDNYDVNYETLYEYNYKVKEGIILNQEDKENKLLLTISKGIIPDSVLLDNNVNELGNIPVLMYHGVYNIPSIETGFTGGNYDIDGYHRTAEAFKGDLEYLYEHDYVAIHLIDYVNGSIDIPLGKSPVVITFDDGRSNNALVTSMAVELTFDENCALGILETFKEDHPDFNTTAIFFLNGGLFGQPAYNDEILKYLIDNGYDIGNHTYTHFDLNKATDENINKDIGRMYELLTSKIADDYTPILALPFGNPKTYDESKFTTIMNTKYNNIEYSTISTLRVGWDSNESPFSKVFNKEFIKRVRAYDNDGIEYDFKMVFEKLENRKYVSDGEPATVTIKKNDKDLVSTDLEVIEY